MKEKEVRQNLAWRFGTHHWVVTFVLRCIFCSGKSPETQESEMFVDIFFFSDDISEKEDVCLVVLGKNCWLKQELTYDDYNPWEVRPTCMKSTGSDYLSNLLSTMVIRPRLLTQWYKKEVVGGVDWWHFHPWRLFELWNHVTKELQIWQHPRSIRIMFQLLKSLIQWFYLGMACMSQNLWSHNSMGFKLLNWPCSLEFGARDCNFPKHANDSFDFHATNLFLI